VVFAAWFGRFLGGIVALAASALLAMFVFSDPVGSLRVTGLEEIRGILLFLGLGLLVSLLIEWIYAGTRFAGRVAEERQRLAEELLVERQRLEILLANLPGLVWEARLEPPLWPPQVQFASPNAQRLTGYTPEQWQRTNLLWDRLLPESDRADFESALRSAGRRGVGTHRHGWVHADGSLRVFETHFTSAPSRVGTYQEVRCVSLDVTELETAERALAATERRFREAADRAPIMIWIATPDRGVSWLNRAWLEFRGRPLDQELGDRWLEALHADDRARFARALRDAFGRLEEVRQEVRIRRADGAWRWVLAVGVPRTGGGGATQDYLGFCIDISERRQLELEREGLLRETERARDEAELATRTKDEFLAKVSHELRNPLNGILGWTQVLASPATTEEEYRRGIERIDTSARSLARLVDDLLDVSRILSGKLRLSLDPVRVRAMLDAACETLAPAAAARGIELECRIEPDLPVLQADPQRLQQVLWNLLSNAVKFSPRGGRVRLHAARRDGAIEILVADDGIGIDPAFLPNVFAPFRQAEGGPDRRHQGLGLGLAISRHIVEQHGGTIVAESAGLDKGATFRIALPLAPAAARQVEPVPDADHQAALEGIHVLVVDDDAVAREVLHKVLARSGAAVAEAASAAEAMAGILSHPPDLIVSDIEMPEEDGYSLVRRLRELPQDRGGDTPAIAVTAYAHSTERQLAFEAGFQEHLAKPVDTEALLGCVRKLARRSDARTRDIA
jgi:PAS domain S-box-containing protein